MAPRPRIFIIDDVPDNIDMLVHALDGMAEVRFALSGAQGLQHIREQVPDLVLLDVMMPVMNGYEVFAELQTNALTASIPVIFVTAKNDPLSETSALNAGAVDFIHKPINPAVVKARVTMHLNYQAREREVLQSHAELEQSRSQLLQSEKMAAVGQLAAGVAHEINNPIGFVSSNLGTLRQYVEQLFSLVDASDRFIQGCGVSEDAELGAARRRVDLPYLKEDLMALLTESRDGLERVKKIVLDLRNFSRIDSAGWHDADLNSGLDSTLNVAMHELKHKAEVVKHYAALPLVHCHPGQMNQVFLNLLVNASQAIAARGTVTLRSGVDGPWVWVSVADTGAGMTPETVSRIFEPFFTTKPVGEGTGLGLSLAYNIVKKHGGRIDVSSTPGTGSCFTVWLPLNTRKEAAA